MQPAAGKTPKGRCASFILHKSFANGGITAQQEGGKSLCGFFSVKTLGLKNKQKRSNHHIKGITTSKLLFSQDQDQLKLLKINIPTF